MATDTTKNLSMYECSIPACIRMLGNLRGVLQKGAAQAAAMEVEDEVFTEARLFPDMFPLKRQVQIASDTAKGCAARLSGQEPPSYTDTERGFSELLARIDKTVGFLESHTPQQIDGSEDRAITIKTPRGDMKFTGRSYLIHFVMPNLHFHVTTAYNILRSNGVDVGKMDYLGAPP